jgi:carboxypeptidase Taq
LSYARVEAQVARVHDLLCAANVLDWDANVFMPAAGAGTRGQQIGTLIALARSLLTSDSLRSSLDAATKELATAPSGDMRRLALKQTKAAVETLLRIPERLLTEAAELKTNAQQSWAEARHAAILPPSRLPAEDFALQRELADASGYAEHPTTPFGATAGYTTRPARCSPA